MLKRILLPLDRSALAECVLPHALAMNSALEAEFSLLHVMPVQPSSDRLSATDPLEWRMRRAEAETYLRSVQAKLEAAGAVVECEVIDGQSAEQIIAFAHEHQIDLILMSSHGQSGLSGWNVSSVVQKVLLRAHISTMIVPAYLPQPADLTGHRYARLLVPVDGSQRAETVLPVVADVARFHEGYVLLVHVVQRPDMPRRTPLSQEDAELQERFVERNRSEAVRYLEELAARMPDVEVETRVIVANQSCAAIALHQLAREEGANLLVLNAHGCTGELAWAYGSVVVSFVAYGSSPLLIVQDVPREQVPPSAAEVALQQGGRR